MKLEKKIACFELIRDILVCSKNLLSKTEYVEETSDKIEGLCELLWDKIHEESDD
jgi:hypothetical protein